MKLKAEEVIMESEDTQRDEVHVEQHGDGDVNVGDADAPPAPAPEEGGDEGAEQAE